MLLKRQQWKFLVGLLATVQFQMLVRKQTGKYAKKKGNK